MEEHILLHPCPHALAPGIVMAASPRTVHALDYAVFRNCHAVDFAGILCSAVRVDDGSPECRIGTDRIGKRLFA